MLKMMLYTDSMYFNPSVLDLPAYLAELTHTKTLEVYFDDMGKTATWYDNASFMTIPGQLADKEKYEIIEKNFDVLVREAHQRNMLIKPFEDLSVAQEAFFKHLRYTDVLLLDIHSLQSPTDDITRYRFFRDILMYGECPVILFSGGFTHIDEIIFAYNGTPSSVFAIRQFTYLFPQLYDKPIKAVYAREADQMHDKKLLIDWMNTHYTQAYYEETDEKLLNSFSTSYQQQKQIFGVMGSFGRSLLSQMLHKSEALHVIRMLPVPLFISHW
ncbi:MAG: hypothetical protein K6T34_04470 [Thermoflavifilum sp.]|nr:hypothetical protein [Thermoflavifilum sp.]